MLLLGGCAGEERNGSRIRVLATTSILGDVLSNILPDTFEVRSLMGPGVDPHLYKATQGDVEQLSSADLIVYNGLHLEGKMAEILNRLSGSGKAFAFAESLDKRRLRLLDSSGHIYDPHIWLDVRRQIMATEELIRYLRSRYPFAEAEIRERGLLYLNELTALDIWCRESIGSLPDSARILVTSHDAFSYFGQAYNFEVRSLVGVSTLAEAGLRDVTELVNYLAEHRVKAIFIENSVSPKALRSVVEGCMRKGHVVRIGGELYSDALGDTQSKAGTYKGMIEHNINQIVGALQ
ncbi:MAG: zinc ABC transporter substrate-binding protein [Flavobacteriales bacterium]|nr:zinc ABC transporter substrate-binding protein [Flavobacteriales bacterium]